ncbi:YbjQ family protein [Patescibacteria group bacterium]|nr:YbjQ family protein [Patescibacteria group bacterium]
MDNNQEELTSDIDRSLVTTTFDISGYKIVKQLGIVKGIMVRSRSIVGNIGAGLQTIFGGNITIYTNMCEKARDDTYNLMCEHAKSLGANAVLGVRYDTNEIANGISEVLCYGTAVIVEKA